MIKPEPNWAADLRGLQPGEAAVSVPLPAAGRLGVIEEKCKGSHEVLDLIALAGVGPCPSCGAAV